MNSLANCQIAVAAAKGERAVQSRIDAMRDAGAVVRFCILSQDLWSVLSETAFDAIVVLLERDDVASLATYDQLLADPRARTVPTLLVTTWTECTALRAALILSEKVDDAGFIHALCGIVAPVRRARDAEDQERATRDELRAELMLSERSAREQAELSHELRTMLGPIVDFACNLRDGLAGPLSSDQTSHVAGILGAVERVTRLLEKSRRGSLSAMRRVSLRPASSPPRVQRTLVHLSRIAAEVAAMFDTLASRKSVRLSCSSDDTVCVWGDSLKLKQIVTNLVVNAVKYTPKGGEVVVRVGWSAPRDSDGVQARRTADIVVTDTGPGVAPEYRQKIFMRGFRIDRHSEVAGEGIGLAVVKELVLQHGGFVTVEGGVTAGAVFRVSLPQDRRQRLRAGEGLHDRDAAQELLAMLASSETAAYPNATWSTSDEGPGAINRDSPEGDASDDRRRVR